MRPVEYGAFGAHIIISRDRSDEIMLAYAGRPLQEDGHTLMELVLEKESLLDACMIRGDKVQRDYYVVVELTSS
jgi:hypothetical protein